MFNSELKEFETIITERVCRITLDCKVKITEITMEKLRKSIYWDERDQESAVGHAEKQRRLLHALLLNAQALDRFLIYVVVNDLGMQMDATPDTRFHVEDEDKILKKVYADMEGEKASSAENGQETQFLFETELFNACFTVDWGRTVLREIKVILGGEEQGEGGKCVA